MIEKLYYYPIEDQYGNCYGSNPPNTYQIVNKINEIIDTINQKENNNDRETKTSDSSAT